MTELTGKISKGTTTYILLYQTKCSYTAAADILVPPLICTCAVTICICNVGKTVWLRWVHGGSGMEEGWEMRS